MMYSGLFHISRKITLILLLMFFASAMFFCASSQVVSAEKENSTSTVDSVNLRSGKWVYSVYSDKNKNRYAAVTRYDGEELEIVIPEELGGFPVKVISREAFYGDKYITSVSLPDTVAEIGKYAFSGCIGLSRVDFSSSLISIGEGAFYGCWSLAGADIPEGTLKIGSFAFYNCRHLKQAEFPASLKTIGDSSFEGCGMLSAVSFGKNLESVGDLAFKGCTSLESIDLSWVTDLGAGAFLKCEALEKAVLGDDITEIRPETFCGCVNLKKVSFGGNTTMIGFSAFEGCSSLRNLPEIDSLTEIGSLAFEGCASLRQAEIGKSVTKIGMSAFRGCTSLTGIIVSAENPSFSTVNKCLYSKDGSRLILCPQGLRGALKIPESAVRIGNYAAMGCTRLSGVSFQGETSEIGRAAFLNCPDITSLSLPDSVKSIGGAALGMYFSDGEFNKEDYFRLYASDGSPAEKYCSEREIPFTPFSRTLAAGSERVVLAEGNTFALRYGFFSDKKAEVAWSSSDESVVTVSASGKLTGISQGNAEITLSAEGFEPAVVSVSVISPDDAGDSNSRSYDKRLIYCGENEELSSIFSQIIDPIFSANRFWYSSDPSVATVTNEGKAYAHKSGSATVICRMPDGSENCIAVTVTEKPAAFSVEAPEDELIVGDMAVIGRSVIPSQSSDEITWKSDNENIVTVDAAGLMTAVGQGKCTVTAETSSGLKSSFEVKCVIPAESLSLSQETRDVYQGKEFNLTAELTPGNSDQTIRWRSSDPTVASVNSKGKVKGVSFGTAVIYAETAGGLSESCRVNVVAHARELSLDVKKLKINCGSVHRLNALVRPSYSPETTDKCTWNSTNEKVATVDENGMVTAVGVGRCIINCRTGGDLISKCQVQVRMPAESIVITSEKDSVYIGETQTLKAVITPEDSTDTVEWSTDNEEIAYVTSGGNVKGVSSGTVVITARLTNDVTGESVSASFEMTVLKKASSVSLSSSSLSLRSGDKDYLTFTILPEDCNDTFRWYSTDEAIASVREDGLITAVSPGTCYICIETGSGEDAKCKVTVS